MFLIEASQQLILWWARVCGSILHNCFDTQNVGFRISGQRPFADNTFVESRQSRGEVGYSNWRLETNALAEVVEKLTRYEGASGLGKAYAQVFAKAG